MTRLRDNLRGVICILLLDWSWKIMPHQVLTPTVGEWYEGLFEAIAHRVAELNKAAGKEK